MIADVKTIKKNFELILRNKENGLHFHSRNSKAYTQCEEIQLLTIEEGDYGTFNYMVEGVGRFKYEMDEINHVVESGKHFTATIKVDGEEIVEIQHNTVFII